MFLEVEKYQCIEMETVWRNTVGLLLLLLQGEFLVLHRKGVCARPGPEHPAAWGGKARWAVKGTAFRAGNCAWSTSSPSISLTRGL